MRVFISSVINGLEGFRSAARDALSAFASDRQLDISMFMSEDYHASPSAAAAICRDEVALADLVVGIYGAGYGSVDAETDKSITHLEALWAIDDFHKPLLAFVLDQSVTDRRQQQLIGWLSEFRLGVWFRVIATEEQLQFELYRALDTAFPRVAWQSRIAAVGQRIRVDDLHHVALPLRVAHTLEQSQLPTRSSDDLLMDAVSDALTDDVAAVFVLGEVGSGKTWFLKELFCQRLDARQEGRTNDVPCFIDLGKTVLDRYDPAWPWDWQSLLGRSDDRMLLLLDAYDEAVAKSPPGSRLKLLESVLSVASESRQLVITSRSHLFETSDRLGRLIDAASYSLRGISLGNLRLPHAILFVKELAEEDVKDFLRVEFEDDDERLWKRMTAVIDLPDLAKRPILLPMVCDSLDEFEDVKEGEKVTAGHLYRVYTERWLARESWRLQFGADVARRFFEELALHFHSSATDSLPFDQFPTVFPGYFPAAQLSAERERLVEALRSASFLSNTATGQYGFVHRSFLEYFVAERLVHALAGNEADLELVRFPSKVTDAFALDLLRLNLDWVPGLISMTTRAVSPIVRYLCAYFASRAVAEDGLLERDRIGPVLLDALETETNPYVVRELLVSLTSMGYQVDDETVVRHLDNPIASDMIARELTDYYGSLEEARRYLRDRLQSPADEPLQLFYLISLAAIASREDWRRFELYSKKGDAYEARVAREALKTIGDWSDGVDGD
jgi:hypothetical protein